MRYCNSQAPLTAALNELFNLKTQTLGESGLYNALYQSDVRIDRVAIVNGRAEVALSGTVSDLDVFEGTADPTVDQSVLDISDGCLSVARSLAVMVKPGSVFHAHRVGDAHGLDHRGCAAARKHRQRPALDRRHAPAREHRLQADAAHVRPRHRPAPPARCWPRRLSRSGAPAGRRWRGHVRRA